MGLVLFGLVHTQASANFQLIKGFWLHGMLRRVSGCCELRTCLGFLTNSIMHVCARVGRWVQILMSVLDRVQIWTVMVLINGTYCTSRTAVSLRTVLAAPEYI